MSSARETKQRDASGAIVVANPAFGGGRGRGGSGGAGGRPVITRVQRRDMMRAGEKVYHTNDYLMYIYDIMENSKFGEFFGKHVHNLSDVNTAMIYFNLFEMVKQQYRETFGKDVTRGEHIYLMQQCMRNRYLRQAAIEGARHLTSMRNEVRGVIGDKNGKIAGVK
jgi:hypothetical protein